MIKQSSLWWIGWIEEVPGVKFQEPTRQELIESLKVTLQESLEFNRENCRKHEDRILRKHHHSMKREELLRHLRSNG